MTIGLPYFMLSTTAPLIQSWFAREHADPHTAKRVYRFFALSNLGALLGLLAYPFAIETWITTRVQAIGWSGSYAVFALLCVASAWRARNLKQDVLESDFTPTKVSEIPPHAKDYALWFALAALPTLMLLAITNHITQNVASIPFMWVLPLTLYLLTFVLCFEGRNGHGFYVRKLWLWPTLLIIILMAWGLTANYGFLAINLAIPLYSIGLFLVCMFCHGELAAKKPAAKFLTRFYLILSLGGAVGGMFVGLIAPNIFSAFWELPLGFAALALVAWVLTKPKLNNPSAGQINVASPWLSLLSLIVVIYFAYDYNKLQKMDNTIAAARNFYGRLSVKQIGYGISDSDSFRAELHGTIQHGKQFVYPANRHFTTSYYSEYSGVGMALAHINPGQPKIGGVGMGIGTIAAHSKKGGSVKFYEINPNVIDYANEYFYYLKESPAPVEVVLGDGRLMLEREPPQQFDVLAIDAFSGDAIPVHLITREAMALYLKHIQPNGAVAFHVTSRYLNLAPVVKQLADAVGYEAVLISDKSNDMRNSPSNWVVVTRNRDFLNAPEVMNNRVNIEPISGMGIWTDDFSNLFQILK